MGIAVLLSINISISFNFNLFNKQMTGVSRDLCVMNKNKHIYIIALRFAMSRLD